MVEGWKRTVAKKPIEEIQKWREKIVGKTKSKICEEFLSMLENSLNMPIVREHPIGSRYVDGFIDDMLLIEFYGNYWHCNPEFYDKEDYILQHHKQISVKQIWEMDGKRNEYILENCNLPLIIIWEQSYIKNREILVQEVKKRFLKGEFKNGNIYVI